MGDLDAENGGPFDPECRYHIPISVYEFGRCAELLQFFLSWKGGVDVGDLVWNDLDAEWAAAPDEDIERPRPG